MLKRNDNEGGNQGDPEMPLGMRLAWGPVTTTAPASGALAQDAVEQFYRSKTINIYIGSSAGGGHHAHARALRRHMGKDNPRNPTIVPQNKPGAGGNKAAGDLSLVAPQDGTALGAPLSGGNLAP